MNGINHPDDSGNPPPTPQFSIASQASSVVEDDESKVFYHKQQHGYTPRPRSKPFGSCGNGNETDADAVEALSPRSPKEAEYLKRWNSIKASPESNSNTLPTRPRSAAAFYQLQNDQSPAPRKKLKTEHIRSQAQGVLDPSSPIITPPRAQSTHLESLPASVQFNFDQPPVPGGGPLTSHPPVKVHEIMTDPEERGLSRPSTGAPPAVNQSAMSSNANRYTHESERTTASPMSADNMESSPRPASGFRQFFKTPSLRSLRQSFSSTRSSSTYVNPSNASCDSNATTMRPNTPGGMSTYSTAAQSVAPSYGGKSTRTLKKKRSGWFNTVGKRKSTFGLGDANEANDPMDIDQGNQQAFGSVGPNTKRMKPSPSLPVLPEIEPTHKLDFNAQEFKANE